MLGHALVGRGDVREGAEQPGRHSAVGAARRTEPEVEGDEAGTAGLTYGDAASRRADSGAERHGLAHASLLRESILSRGAIGPGTTTAGPRDAALTTNNSTLTLG
ncbi:hypothetical protein AMK14_02645 [Streptomyces sp. TSRI0445]|nr:hypothetical protein DIJ69_09440 [Streptomyces globisporus]OKI72217.1 hypothetical protein AMK14_02645 [Streptomyces sp. TSRI0445]PPA39961.1 hypothetical protein BF14_009465 [Streptomyces griseus]RAN17327.1 hypothetical protein A3838_09270 [Streptomyces badius]RAN25205.1 hypothetical protein A3800_09275 [Streptomyces badius]